MSAGLGLLGLTPRAFWSMTPRELTAALASLSGVHGSSAVPTREELSALMRRFPDCKENRHE
jgi:uncharacterized phage protein (TIGR02216 family)